MRIMGRAVKCLCYTYQLSDIQPNMGKLLMTYKPFWVANSFLYQAKQEKMAVDHLKLQKLVYCLHGWHLATRTKPVVGEFFEAWPYGPVLPSLYREFKMFGSDPITEYAADIDPHNGERKALMIGKDNANFYEVFERVWRRYRNLSGLQLSALTHASGTPWSKARLRRDDYLSDAEIREAFVALAKGDS